MKVILSGSGAKYPAHVGALKRISEEYTITDIAGVSGGAIVAAAYASGFDWINNDLTELTKKLSPGKLIDYRYWPFSEPYGLIKGNKLLDTFKTLFHRDFDAMLCNLHLVTVDLCGDRYLIWNSRNSPNADVAYIVRASMSIPLVFNYVKVPAEWHYLTDHLSGKTIQIDGGVTNNFPLDMFGAGDDVIGVKLVSPSSKERKKPSSIKNYISQVIDAMITASENEHIEDALYARTLYITVPFSGLDFDTKPSDIETMMQIGYEAADHFLKTHR